MNCVIWGGTGQAKVVRPILESDGHRLVALFDNEPSRVSPFPDVELLGGWDAFARFRAPLGAECGFVVAVGGSRGEERCELSERLTEAGLQPLRVIHERAFVATDCVLGRGAQVMAMAALGVCARLGDFCIVNTSATVDHDCVLADGVHVMPGAILAGEVRVGAYAAIGAGATVLPRVAIGARAVVGAGAVVTRDVEPGIVVVGVPARPQAHARSTRDRQPATS